MPVAVRTLSPWDNALVQLGLLAVLLLLLFVVLIPFVLATRARQASRKEQPPEGEVVLPARPTIKGRSERPPPPEPDR